jgi:phosphatidylglycerophosphate synthase
MRKLSVKYENPIDNIIYLFVEPLAPYMYKWNITPNMITTLGNISWVYGLYLLYNHEYVYSALLFGLSYYFDCLDGYVARKYHLISIFGDYYDHISDVTKGCSYLFMLYYLNKDLLIHFLPIIILGLFLSMVHLYYQEKLHNKNNDSPTLSSLSNLIPNILTTKNQNRLKKRLKFTKYFGTGTSNFFMFLLILLFGYKHHKKGNK